MLDISLCASSRVVPAQSTLWSRRKCSITGDVEFVVSKHNSILRVADELWHGVLEKVSDLRTASNGKNTYACHKLEDRVLGQFE